MLIKQLLYIRFNIEIPNWLTSDPIFTKLNAKKPNSYKCNFFLLSYFFIKKKGHHVPQKKWINNLVSAFNSGKWFVVINIHLQHQNLQDTQDFSWRTRGSSSSLDVQGRPHTTSWTGAPIHSTTRLNLRYLQ